MDSCNSEVPERCKHLQIVDQLDELVKTIDRLEVFVDDVIASDRAAETVSPPNAPEPCLCEVLDSTSTRVADARERVDCQIDRLRKALY